MNYLVFLDASAGELEKILSGTKSMVVKGIDPACSAGQAVCPGDSLYFLRNVEDRAVRVKATVVRVIALIDSPAEDLSDALKEMQPKLQLTEDQYNYWSAKQQVWLIEFASAHKIDVIELNTNQIMDRMDWIVFEEITLIPEKKTL